MLDFYFNKVILIKTDSGEHWCFPVKFAEFLRTPFFTRTSAVAASDCHLFLIEYQIICCYKKIALLLNYDDNANNNKATFH